MKLHVYLLLCAICLIAACAPLGHEKTVTIKSLQGREFVLKPDMGIEGIKRQAIERYQAFLDTAPDTPMRVEAVRRLADLQLEQGDELPAEQRASTVEGGDYTKAIQLYQDLLTTYPNHPNNDRMLYQLARAYDSIGQADNTLAVLDRLISAYPDSPYMDEAQFRRAEILFVIQDYEAAKQSYEKVLASSEAARLHEQALYKYCWSLFKQEHYQEDIGCFLKVLDLKLTPPDVAYSDEILNSLPRADRELVDDALRVVSLSFSYLSDDISITDYLAAHGARPYDHLVYGSVGELYLIKERYTDAANIYRAFADHNPGHIKAPLYHIKAIDAYYSGAYSSLVLKGKLDFVERFGLNGPFWKKHTIDETPETVAYLKKSLVELASYYHALAQRSKRSADYQQAALMYQHYLDYFPEDSQSPGLNFLLAEVLFEDGQYYDAAMQYEKTAYDYRDHDKGAEAGYAALLAYRKHEEHLSGDNKKIWHRQSLGSALQFADRYPSHPQADIVLTRAAEDFFALDELDIAGQLAARVLQKTPPVSRDLRLPAWTITAHVAFDGMAYDKAEAAYQEVLALMSRDDPKRTDTIENLASSIYKQGELFQDINNQEAAIEMFLRVGKVTPTSTIHAVAEYDAATMLMSLRQWPRVITILERFNRSFPKHPLQKEIPAKLAVSYLESGQYDKAAKEFETIVDISRDPEIQQDAILQAAQMYEKAGNIKDAALSYKRFITLFPEPPEQTLEARQHLADLNKALGDIPSYRIRLQQIIDIDKQMGKARTERSRYLASQASLVLAQYAQDAYSEARLKEPLKKSLKVKKKKMEQALDAYTQALDYGISEITTAATYRIAEIYHDFGRELLKSDRPKGLSADELEQYDILLEEQAYPFEEKAITAHEDNIHHVSAGIYDKWVIESYRQLAELLPIRYAKGEKSEQFDEALH